MATAQGFGSTTGDVVQVDDSNPPDGLAGAADLIVIDDEGGATIEPGPGDELLTIAEATQRFVVAESELRRQLTAGAIEGATEVAGPGVDAAVIEALVVVVAELTELVDRQRLDLANFLGRQQDDLAAAYGELVTARLELSAELEAERARSDLLADELARSRAEVEHLRSQADLDRIRLDELRAPEEPTGRRRFGRST